MTQSGDRLSPRGAVAFGLLFMLCGAFPVLAGLGVFHTQPSPDAPRWLIIASGTMFILAGLAIINGYAFAGGAQPDGNLPDNAPLFRKVTQYVLGLAIVALMFAVFAWVSFGPGERHFSSTISVPGLSSSGHSSEHSGRIAFGIGTVLMGLFLVFATISGAKRLWRDVRGRPGVG